MQDIMTMNHVSITHLATKWKQNKMIITDCCKQELKFQEC